MNLSQKSHVVKSINKLINEDEKSDSVQAQASSDQANAKNTVATVAAPVSVAVQEVEEEASELKSAGRMGMIAAVAGMFFKFALPKLNGQEEDEINSATATLDGHSNNFQSEMADIMAKFKHKVDEKEMDQEADNQMSMIKNMMMQKMHARKSAIPAAAEAGPLTSA